MNDFPPPQTKPKRTLNYAEKLKLKLVAPKKRAQIRKVSKKNAPRLNLYSEWIKIAMHGVARCEMCRRHKNVVGELQPHHPFARLKDNLFRVTPLCGLCHVAVHAISNEYYLLGWLQPEFRSRPHDPNWPVPFTLLPPPQNKSDSSI